MYLPEYVLNLIQQLESRGHQAWAVGGCVRDSILGILPADYDLCTSALPEQTQAVFAGQKLVLAGLKHGTVGVITDDGVVEITTFRTEGDYSDQRHPGWVRFVPTIEEDLSRRDFTVNAMAYSPTRGYADPFGGREDLKNRILRAVGDPALRFQEDALRILRGIRFAARFRMTIHPDTRDAMTTEAPGLDHLAKERIFSELSQFLRVARAEDLLEAQPLLARVIPELEQTMGFDQRNPHHMHDVFTHIAHVVAGVPGELTLRLAALLHDVGKPPCFTLGDDGRGHFHGHAQLGAEMANEILHRLKAPTALREEVVWLIHHHMSLYPCEPKAARRALSRHGLDRMERLLRLQLADLGGKGVNDCEDTAAGILAFRELLRQTARDEGELTLKTLAVKGNDLMAHGWSAGPELGQTLNRLLQAVIAGELPNDREPLLAAADRMRN